MEREINGLIKVTKFLNAQKLQIITRNEERTITNNGITIEVIPIWKWLIETNNQGQEQTGL